MVVNNENERSTDQDYARRRRRNYNVRISKKLQTINAQSHVQCADELLISERQKDYSGSLPLNYSRELTPTNSNYNT